MTRIIPPLIIGLILGVIVTIAFNHLFPQKWEYKIEWVSSRDVDTQGGVVQLARDGAKGWEITGVIPSPNPASGDWSMIILKRKK